jgi:PAS domain S-box-containing protein
MTPESPTASIHVLVVESAPERAESLTTRLATEFRVTCVETVADALEALDATDEVECVVSEYDLPGSDGVELVRRIRTTHGDLPCVLVVEGGSEAVASEAISAGVTDYWRAGMERTRLVAGIRNAVAHYRTEREATRVRSRLEAILDANPDFVFVFDEDAAYQEIVAGAADITAHPPEEFIGRSVDDLWPSAAATEIRRAVRDTIETGEGQQIEYRLPVEGHRDERTFAWYEGRTAPIDFEREGGSHVLLSAREITARKDAERTLRRTQRAVEASGHAIYITDADGRIEYVNPAFEEITGYAADEAIGQTPNILKSGLMPEEYYENLWQTLRADEVWEEEIVNRRNDGELYYTHQTIAPVEGDDGGVEAFVAIQTDITERKRMEAELRENVRQLRVIDRVLRHNLHNDMNVVLGNAELIRDEAGGDVAEQADRIVATGEKLLQTVDKERDITEHLANPPEREPVDVVHVVETTIEGIRDRYPAADVDVDVPDEAVAHATAGLARVLEELLENAVVHSDRDEPSIEVTVVAHDDRVELRVADDGPGIPEMERTILAGEEEIEPLYHGSGLGLWLVYLLVRQSGGTISFEENDPRGSVVVVELSKRDGATGRPPFSLESVDWSPT